MQREKCVIVLDQHLPLGLIANTAAILGVTLGRDRPDTVGPDVVDRDGGTHRGIVAIPIPILRGDRQLLSELRQTLAQPAYAGLTVVDFSDLAQSCNDYESFQAQMADAPGDSLAYLGVAICGEKRLVNHLTGSLPLLR